MLQGYKHTYELYKHLEEGNYNRFLSSYWLKRPFLKESDKQRLLAKIIEGCYNNEHYKIYKTIFYPFKCNIFMKFCASNPPERKAPER